MPEKVTFTLRAEVREIKTQGRFFPKYFELDAAGIEKNKHGIPKHEDLLKAFASQHGERWELKRIVRAQFKGPGAPAS